MNKELLELLDSINEQKIVVRNLAKAGKIDEAKEAKNKLKELQDEFDILKDIEDTTPAPKNPKPVTPNPKDTVEARFADAARHGFRDSYTGLSEGDDAKGGYTVPKEVSTKIREYKEAEFNLGQLVTVENTKYIEGEWTYDKKGETEGFVEVPENGKIPQVDTGSFERKTYKIKKYAGIVAATSEIMTDSDANLTNYISKKLGKKSAVTENKMILKALADGKKDESTDTVKYEVVDESKGVDGLTKLINITLGSAYNKTSKIITNDYGIQTLCEMKDANGRSLVQPDPTEPTKMRLAAGAILIPIVQVPKEIMPNVTDGGKTYAPIVVGDLKEAFILFDRNKITIKASDVATVGDMSAYEQDLTFFRAIERKCIMLQDADAYVYAHFKTEIK